MNPPTFSPLHFHKESSFVLILGHFCEISCAYARKDNAGHILVAKATVCSASFPEVKAVLFKVS